MRHTSAFKEVCAVEDVVCTCDRKASAPCCSVLSGRDEGTHSREGGTLNQSPGTGLGEAHFGKSEECWSCSFISETWEKPGGQRPWP